MGVLSIYSSESHLQQQYNTELGPMVGTQREEIFMLYNTLPLFDAYVLLINVLEFVTDYFTHLYWFFALRL